MRDFQTPFVFHNFVEKRDWVQSKKQDNFWKVVLIILFQNILFSREFLQKQPPKGVLKERCSENMQQIYSRTSMPKCDLNKVALQLYWNRTSAWVFPVNLLYILRSPFLKNTSWWLLLFLAYIGSFGSGIIFYLKRDLGLVFGARFLHKFSIKMFLI